MARTLTTTFQVEDLTAHEVVSFELVRELGRPPVLEIEVRFLGDVTPVNATGGVAAFVFSYGEDAPHQFMGVVESVTSIATPVSGDSMQGAHFRVVSRMAPMEGSVGAEIFQDKKVDEIVTAVLVAHGVPATEQKWQLTGTYPKREYCVRYMESALAFVSRLLEEEGIFFFTSFDDGKEIITFVDDSSSAAPIDGKEALPFRGVTGLENSEDAIFSIVEHAEIRSGKYTLRDYDFKRPSLDMTGTAEGKNDAELERYDYPGLYVEPSDGKRLAQVRLEADQAQREIVSVLADCPRIEAGRLMKIEEALFADLDGEYLVTSVVHRLGPARGPESLGATAPRSNPDKVEHDAHPAAANAYRCIARLIPKGVPFRTPQTTERPVIDGPQTALVVAPTGSEAESIHTDEHGRCKVKFHWDLGPDLDDKASCWMRVAQLQTSGSMMLPRIDMEVVVEFIEGNPDRPLVTAMLYNGQNMPPYALPEGKTRTSIQTRSTPGGGGTNEIRFEDMAGGEEVMLKAQHNHTMATANDKKKTVGKNSTRTIGADETIDVGANQTTKVTMGNRVTVTADQSISVGGNRNVEVNAVTALTVGAASSNSIGGNHFEMDGNPLQALLNIATQVAIEAAQAAAGAAMAQVQAAVQSRVDQAMAPINNLTAQAQQMGAGMQALQNGDMGAMAGLAGQAAGLPVPPAFGGGGGDAAAGGGGGEAGGGGGEAGGGEAGGGIPNPGAAASGAVDNAVAAVNGAVDNAIQQGMTAGAGALASALGLDGAGGGGASTANADGPVGDVAGIDGTDRAKGPGHSIHKVDASYSETVGSVRIQAALMGVHTTVSGTMTESVSAAKVTGAIGDITTNVAGAKTDKALGFVHFAKGDQAESIAAGRQAMVTGLIYDKITGSRNTKAGAPATFIGAFHKIEAGTSITLKCGESEVVIDGSGIAITSPMVAFLSPKIQLTKDVDEA